MAAITSGGTGAAPLTVSVPARSITLRSPSCCSNPLTIAPAYLGAYWVGTHLTGEPFTALHFEPTWQWVDTQLRAIWKPFLLGCLVSGCAAALLGYGAISLWWRAAVTHRYQRRPAKLRRRSDAIEQNSALER